MLFLDFDTDLTLSATGKICQNVIIKPSVPDAEPFGSLCKLAQLCSKVYSLFCYGVLAVFAVSFMRGKITFDQFSAPLVYQIVRYVCHSGYGRHYVTPSCPPDSRIFKMSKTMPISERYLCFGMMWFAVPSTVIKSVLIHIANKIYCNPN